MKNRIFFSFILFYLSFNLFADTVENGRLMDDKWAFSLSYSVAEKDTLYYCSYGGNVVVYDTFLNPIDTLFAHNLVKDIDVFNNGNVVVGRYREGFVIYDSYGNLIGEKTDVYVENIEICNDTMFAVSYGGGIKFYNIDFNELCDIPMGFVKRILCRNDTLFVSDTVNTFVLLDIDGDTLYDSGINGRDISIRGDTVYIVKNNYFLKFSLSSLSVVDSVGITNIVSVVPLDDALIGICGIYNIYLYTIEDTLFTDTLLIRGIVRNVSYVGNKLLLSLDYNGVDLVVYNDSLEYIGNIDRYNEITGISYSPIYNKIYGGMGTYSGTGNFSFNYGSGNVSLDLKQDYGGSSYNTLIYNDTLLIIASKWYGIQICKITPDSLEYISRFDTYSAYNVDVLGNYVVIADYSHGIKVVDVSDIYSPVLIDSLNTGSYTVDVKFINDTIIVAGNYTGGISVIKFDGTLSELYNMGNFRVYALDKKDSLIFAGGDSLVALQWTGDTLVEKFSVSTDAFIYDIIHAPWDNEIFLADRYTYQSFVYDSLGFTPRFYYKRYDIWPKSVGFAGYYLLGGSRYCGMYSFIVDVSPPICDSVIPGENISINNTVASMEFYVSDDRSGIRDLSLECDGRLPDSFFYDTLLGYVYGEWSDLSEGVHNVTLSMTDSSYNTSSYNYTINVDFTSPYVSSVYPLPFMWAGISDSLGFINFYDISPVNATVILNGDTVSSHVINDTVFYNIPQYNDTFFITLHLEDAVGNKTDTSYYFMKDVEPIDLYIISPANISSDSIVNFTALMIDTNDVNSPIDSISLFIDNNPVNIVVNGDTLKYAGFIGEGEHTYRYFIKDESGNTTDVEGTLVNDYIPPFISYIEPANNSYLNTTMIDFNIIFEENFVKNIQFLIDGNDLTDVSAITDSTIEYTNITPLSDTLHTLYVYIEDTAGFYTDTTIYFTIDTTHPFISYVYPQTESIYQNIDTLKFVPSERLRYLFAVINDDTILPLYSNDTIKCAFNGIEGWNSITVYLEDSANNPYIYRDSIGMDITPPSNIRFTVDDSLIRGSMVKLEWSRGEDNFSGISFYSLYRDDTLLYTGGSNIFIDYPLQGDHTYLLYTEDNTGNGMFEDTLIITRVSGIDYVKIYPNPLNLNKTRVLHFEGLDPDMECYLYSEDGRLLYKVVGNVESNPTLFFDKDYTGILRIIIKDEEGNTRKGVLGVYR